MAYLDHAATSPLRPEALAAMTEAWGHTGNASSLHASGRAARRVVEESREAVADALGARPSEVVFTSGGTESDNIAVQGLFRARRAADPSRTRILCGAVEHHAVLDAVRWLADHEGAQVGWLEVDAAGRVQPEVLAAALRDGGPDTVALVTCMAANNEIGTVNDVTALAEIAHEYGIPIHVDAVQRLGQLPTSAVGIDALTVTAHKCGGPYGAGALVLRRDLDVTPVVHGGGQERDVRSGTLDPPALAGFAAAVRAATADLPATAATLRRLRGDLVTGVLAAVPEAVLNGDPDLDGDGRLPGNAHLSFPGCEGDALMMLLDARGVECSTGSACSAGVAKPSHVLLALGADADTARSSLRFTLGHSSTDADVRAVTSAIGPAVERARAAAMSRRRG
ncbi:MAG TPA: cysteine desulfurase family protein [Mycobacteriales bacterium]